ncbi:15639_t:CDS:2 [Cetraspora pellucida]|uniref:15639_t:CDS:1 n=1 Tax=Cetraspora pellucida TaxID=1433469 RepID=A0A9N9ICV8_9GLOM|nr:15639_t:CDS:2 [Cetraspora pellucida]
MTNVYMLNEINGEVALSDNKLGDLPSNQYLPSRIELKNQLTCTKHNLDIALSLGIQLVEELEQDVSLAQKKLTEMDSFKFTTQRVLIEKDTLLQEAVLNKAYLADQIPKTSSESEVAGGVLEGPDVSEQKKGNDNASSETTWGFYRDYFLKNSKTEIPSMKLHLLDIDEVTKHELFRNIGYLAMTWPFSMLITERSSIDKTNLLVNLVLGDKDKYVQRGKKDSKVPYYEDISFSYIPSKRILNTRTFSSKRSKLIIIEDLCLDSDRLENDPLAIQLRFDILLNLQKEIDAKQKHKEKNASANS